MSALDLVKDCIAAPVDAATHRLHVVTIFGGRVLFGQERANLEVLTALRSAGCDVTVLMRNEDWPEVHNFRALFKQHGFNVVQQPFCDPVVLRYEPRLLWQTIYGLFASSFALRRLVKESNDTVIYLFNSYYALTILGHLIFHSTPLVYRAGDVPPTHNAFRRILWRIIRRRLRHCVAVSNFIADALVKLGVKRERISVIYSRPRAAKEINPCKEPAGETAQHKSPSIVYVGQITPEKGLAQLECAFQILAHRFPDVQLLVVGRILPDWLGDAFARALRDRMLSEPIQKGRVKFLGFVDDVYPELRRSRVHVQPSIWDEPLANTVMEAKQAGVPSVIFASGGLPEVISDGVDGTICVDKTPEALAEAIAPYLADAELARRRGMAARASLAAYGVDRFEEAWLNVIRGAR